MTSTVVGKSIRDRVGALLAGDLTFAGSRGNTTLLHSVHAFGARFPAQLPSYFIEGLTEAGELVLDPMAGSGATLLEGWLLARRTIGIDLDPLAVRLCRVKTRWMDANEVRRSTQRVATSALLSAKLGNPMSQLAEEWDDATRSFIDYWFKPETQQELAALVLSIRDEPSAPLRPMLEVLLSSVIVTKSGGVSMARDLAHTRPHRVLGKKPKSAIKAFEAQAASVVRYFESSSPPSITSNEVIRADAKSLPLGENSVDLVLTSPPYANALDYVRAHKFSLVWLGSAVRQLARAKAHYIGSERQDADMQARLPLSVAVEVASLEAADPRKALVLHKYFRDMHLALGEMYRVLRPGRAAMLVVGPSTMRGHRIETHRHLASIAQMQGFDLIGTAQRAIARDHRMMPAHSGVNDGGGIEERIHEEFVIGLVKPK